MKSTTVLFVYGPCEVPPEPGKYDEEWIAFGTFTGTINESPASGTLTYTAQVEAGGNVKGHMVFDDGINGEITVSGNFYDGKLKYMGVMK